MRTVFIIGLPGSGKTTLGTALSISCDPQGRRWRFVDLDQEIERRSGMSVSEIFARHGEEHFRDLETALLAEMAQCPLTIVACGGGTPCHHGNMELMNRCGLTVRLDASDATLLRRWQMAPKDQRPLIAGMDAAAMTQYLRELHDKRDGYYGRAALAFPSEKLENEADIAESVTRFFELISQHI